MKVKRAFHSCLLISALTLGGLACGGGGGGGGGGESFDVSGLWSQNGTSTAGTPDPNSGPCSTVASVVGPLGPSTIDVVRQDGTVTASELGSGLAFTGTVDDSTQAFTLDATTPVCSTQGSCTVCASAGIDFLDAAGNTANVNVAIASTGSGSCPVTCTIIFQTTATRS